MLIKIYNSRLFNTNPAIRFSKWHNVSEDLWIELWKRYKILGYSIEEMAEFFKMKSGKEIKNKQLKRWIFVTEIFIMTKPAREKRARVVSTELFGKLEQEVIYEMTRAMRECGAKKSNTLL